MTDIPQSPLIKAQIDLNHALAQALPPYGIKEPGPQWSHAAHAQLALQSRIDDLIVARLKAHGLLPPENT